MKVYDLDPQARPPGERNSKSKAQKWPRWSRLAAEEQWEMEVERRLKTECTGPCGIRKVLKKGQIARLKQDFRRLAQHHMQYRLEGTFWQKEVTIVKPRRPRLTNYVGTGRIQTKQRLLSLG